MRAKISYYFIHFIAGLCFLQSLDVYGSSSPASSFSINFELVNGLIILEASIDDQKGKYILDTGCNFIAIDGQADDSAITLSSTEFTTNASETNLNTFELGAIKKRNLSALTFDMEEIADLVDVEIDGLIGTQVIKDYNIMIDYAEEKVFFIGGQSSELNIDAMSHTIMKAEMLTVGEQSFIDVQINDQSYKVLLDSGANISVMDSRLKRQFQSIHQPNLSSKMKDDFTIDELAIDRIKMEKLGIIYRDLSAVQAEGFKIDGILSLTSLNIDKVFFNYESGQVIFFWAKQGLASRL